VLFEVYAENVTKTGESEYETKHHGKVGTGKDMDMFLHTFRLIAHLSQWHKSMEENAII